MLVYIVLVGGPQPAHLAGNLSPSPYRPVSKRQQARKLPPTPEASGSAAASKPKILPENLLTFTLAIPEHASEGGYCGRTALLEQDPHSSASTFPVQPLFPAVVLVRTPTLPRTAWDSPPVPLFSSSLAVSPAVPVTLCKNPSSSAFNSTIRIPPHFVAFQMSPLISSSASQQFLLHPCPSITLHHPPGEKIYLFDPFPLSQGLSRSSARSQTLQPIFICG